MDLNQAYFSDPNYIKFVWLWTMLDVTEIVIRCCDGFVAHEPTGTSQTCIRGSLSPGKEFATVDMGCCHGIHYISKTTKPGTGLRMEQ